MSQTCLLKMKRMFQEWMNVVGEVNLTQGEFRTNQRNKPALPSLIRIAMKQMRICSTVINELALKRSEELTWIPVVSSEFLITLKELLQQDTPASQSQVSQVDLLSQAVTQLNSVRPLARRFDLDPSEDSSVGGLKTYVVEVLSSLDALMTEESHGESFRHLKQALDNVDAFQASLDDTYAKLQLFFRSAMRRLRTCHWNAEKCETLVLTLKEACTTFCGDYYDSLAMRMLSILIERLTHTRKEWLSVVASETFRKIVRILIQDANTGCYTWECVENLIKSGVNLYRIDVEKQEESPEFLEALKALFRVTFDEATESVEIKRRIVQMLAFREVTRFFAPKLSKERWTELFDFLLSQLHQVAGLTMREDVASTAKTDWLNVQNQTIIAGYSGLMRVSPAFRASCLVELLAWCSDHPEFIVDVEVNLDLLVGELHYRSRRGFTDAYVPQIVDLWRGRKRRALLSIPVTLIGFTSVKEFILRYSCEIVPTLCQENAETELTRIADLSGMQVEEVLSFALDLTLKSDEVRSTVSRIDRLKASVIAIVASLYRCQDVLPDETVPHLDARHFPAESSGSVSGSLILQCLQKLNSDLKLDAKRTFLENLSLQSPSEVLKIVSKLYDDLLASEGSWERFLRSKRLLSLMDQVSIQNLQTGKSSALISQVFQSILKHAMKRCLPSSTLDSFDEKTKEIIKAMLYKLCPVEEQAFLIEADIFNNCEKFGAALNVFLDKPLNHTALEQLHDQLIMPGKDALKALYSRLRTGGGVFSEEAGVLQKLVKILASFLATAPDDQAKLLAARCLGTLGPCDLGALVFEDVSDEKNVFEKDDLTSSMHFCCLELLLNDGLFSGDPSAIEQATDALLHIFSDAPYLCREVVGYGQSGRPRATKFHELLMPFIQNPDENYSSESVESDDQQPPRRKIMFKIDPISSLKSPLLRTTADFVSRSTNAECVNKFFPDAIFFALTSSLGSPGVFKEVQACIARGINKYLDSYLEASRPERNVHVVDASSDARSVSIVIETVRKIISRDLLMFRPEGKRESQLARLSEFTLVLNQLAAAQAAFAQAAYLTSIMLLELWFSKFLRNGKLSSEHNHLCEHYCPIRYSMEIREHEAKVAHELLVKAYQMIGDEDSVKGCIQIFTDDESSSMEALELSGDWESLLAFGDRSKELPGVLRALHSAKLFTTLYGVARSEQSSEDPDVIGLRFEAAWRLTKWDDADLLLIDDYVEPSNAGNALMDAGFHEHMYRGFLDFVKRNKEGFDSNVNQAILSVCSDPALKSLEACATVYPVLGKLRAILALETSYSLLEDEPAAENILRFWAKQDEISSRLLEGEMSAAVRVASLTSALNLSSPQSSCYEKIRHGLVRTLLAVAETASSARWGGMALQALTMVSKHCGKSVALEKLAFEGKLLEAGVCRMTNANDRGKRILKNLIDRDNFKFPIHVAAAKITYGDWMSTALSEPPKISIVTLEDAINLLTEHLEGRCSESNDFASTISTDRRAVEDRLADAYYVLGKVSDNRYRQLSTQYRSDDFQAKIRRVRELKETVKTMKSRYVQLSQQSHFVRSHLEKVAVIDEVGCNQISAEINLVTATALRSYGQAMLRAVDGKHDLRIFRFVALWLSAKGEANCLAEAGKIIQKLPTYKFLPLLPQLAAQLSAGSDGLDTFAGQLRSLLGASFRRIITRPQIAVVPPVIHGKVDVGICASLFLTSGRFISEKLCVCSVFLSALFSDVDYAFLPLETSS
ncbi:unnamed protein product [Notodromas monacha]|uniref:FAT domain-containing protein n=1 Tax=Notodromas monacha TaxID=399045 RepID=A0A7R9BNP0_9CRUS|nr:unnamed protein product [Notodromas monacha]CAG0918837.1 unnamed protein product [Notodromas monacha]